MNPTKPAPTESGLLAVICAWWKSWRMLKQWSPSTVGMTLALLVTLFIFMDWQMTPGLAKIRGYANQAVRWEDVPNLDYNYALVLKILPWLAAVVVAVALGTGVVKTMGLLFRQMEEVWWVEKMKCGRDEKAVRVTNKPEVDRLPDGENCSTSVAAGREFGRLSPEERRRLPELIAYSATSNLHQIVMPNLDQLRLQHDQWRAYLVAVEEAQERGTLEDKARIKAAANQKARMILDRVFSKAGWLNNKTRRLWREEGFLSHGPSQMSTVGKLREIMHAIATEIEERVQILNSGIEPRTEELGVALPGLMSDEGMVPDRPKIVVFEEEAFPKRLFFFSREDFITGILEEAYRNARSGSACAGSIQITFHYAYPLLWISIMRQAGGAAEQTSGAVAKAAMGMGAYYMELAASLGNISVCHLQPSVCSCDEVVFIGLWTKPADAD